MSTEHDGRNEVAELAASVFGDSWERTGDDLDADLWATLEETGLARLTLPEASGGSEGTIGDAAAVLVAAGEFAARIPLVETDLVAGALLHAAGLDLPQGPLAAVLEPAAVELEVRAQSRGAVVSGALRRVPWGRSVAGIAVLTGERVLLVDPSAGKITRGANLAREPRDDVYLDGVEVAAAPAPAGAAEEYGLRAALGRSLLIAGAAQGAVAMGVRYATERIQFGRPLSKLQAVQQQLALAGGEAAAALAAAQAAALEVERHGCAAAWVPVAAAKARSGEAAGQVARIVHQVHGAIGFTLEHDLRRLTTRLWAWREEAGSEAAWNGRLGTHALGIGPDGLWPLLVGTAHR